MFNNTITIALSQVVTTTWQMYMYYYRIPIFPEIHDMPWLTRWDLYDLHNLIFLTDSQLTVVFHQHGCNGSLRMNVALGFLYDNKRYNQWTAIYKFNVNSCTQRYSSIAFNCLHYMPIFACDKAWENCCNNFLMIAPGHVTNWEESVYIFIFETHFTR